MQKKAFYENKLKAVIDEYVGFFSFNDFKEQASYANELRAKMKSTAQVVILENVKVLTKEIRDWLESEWFPKAIQSDLKYMAFVVPKSAIAQMSMKSANQKAEQESPIEMSYFSTKEEAYSWISSVSISH